MRLQVLLATIVGLCVFPAINADAAASHDPAVTLPVVARPYPSMQPERAKPAEHLYVADVHSLDHDQQLLLASLQGIVNRKQPRIYLVWGDDDRFWLKQMIKHGQTGSPIPVADPITLISKFRDEINGAVVPDPNVYDSPCVAVDLAGLDNVVIAPAQLADDLGLPIKDDLRGKFADDADALRYARTALLPRMNKYLCLCIDPSILGSQVDDVIAAKGSCFWVTGPKAQDFPGANENKELAEVKLELSELPLGTIVRGFWWHGDGLGLDEGPGVALASNYGKITTVSDYVANYSVTSGIRIASLKQKPQPPAPALDKSKVYVAIAVSDGDNLCTWRGYFRQFFTDPLHGKFPIAWGMGPTLLDIAPNEAKWYYDHATPTDEFICDVSGVGYIYPPEFATKLSDRPAAMKTFYDWTTTYMNKLDMHTLRLMDIDIPNIQTVGEDLPTIPFLMPDYGWSGEGDNYTEYTYTLPTGQPVFRAITTSADEKSMVDQIRKRVGAVRPAFINVFIINWSLKLADMQQMLTDLGPDYVAVTPSQLDTLYRANSGGVAK
jgi:hypothetical protein